MSVGKMPKSHAEKMLKREVKKDLLAQIKVMDFIARGMKFAEKAPESVLRDALARARVLLKE